MIEVKEKVPEEPVIPSSTNVNITLKYYNRMSRKSKEKICDICLVKNLIIGITFALLLLAAKVFVCDNVIQAFAIGVFVAGVVTYGLMYLDVEVFRVTKIN